MAKNTRDRTETRTRSTLLDPGIHPSAHPRKPKENKKKKEKKRDRGYGSTDLGVGQVYQASREFEQVNIIRVLRPPSPTRYTNIQNFYERYYLLAPFPPL